MSKQKATIGVTHQFSAVIDKRGINPCVEVPERITRPFLRKGYIAVRGLLNKHPFGATLVPVGNGKYILYINGAMRKAAKVDVGDRIKIALEPDAQLRTIPIPRGFKMALVQNPKARTEFERLTPSRRKDILLYMNALKRPESLHKLIERVIKSLTAKK